MQKSYPDFLVIGGGVIGLSVARELKRRERGARVVVIEKERACGMHASGRNSGVLHAGFYYSPDSLKARFTKSGNALMTQYCVERGLPINRCGKLVVGERAGLQALFDRGVANGVKLELIDAQQANEIEPRAIVQDHAIWSPTTSTVDPHAVMHALVRDATNEGIEIRTGVAWTPQLQAGYTINSAGLGAVAIARHFGFASHYRMLPFRGLYLYSNEPPGALRTNLYPVPDPRFPFLGVHFTITVDGHIKIGPTARPSVLQGARLLATHPELRALAIEELRKTSRKYIVKRAAVLARDVRVDDYTRWGTPGVRAQLYDTRKHALEMDFVIEHDERSLHILNAVSPGFTCAMSFAEHVVSVILSRGDGEGSPADER
jgi:L-2-hydroxyglutarate oxidase LhgO